MLDLSEEQKMAKGTIRTWCSEKLEPKVLALEAGEASIYPLMREMAPLVWTKDIT